MNCETCGTVNPETSKFCAECGSALGAAREVAKPDGERRQATVLFADMAGSTPLAEQLGEEAVFALMRKVIGGLIEVVEAHGGAVQEVMGDGIMALFGAPVAVEGAPFNAVQAALEIHKRVANDSVAIEAEYGVRPNLRVGLHAGPVVVGEMGFGANASVTALGDTVNMAARLEEAAEPGTTLLSQEMYSLVAGFVEVSDLGAITLKGKSTAQRVYRLDGVREGLSRFEASVQRGLTPMSGRGQELAELSKFWQATENKGIRIVDIVGETGVGKSRLMYEFRQELEAKDVFVLQGQCAADGRSRPFLPFIEVVRSSFRMAENASREEILQKLNRGISFLGLDAEALTPYLLNLLGVELKDTRISELAPEVLGSRTRNAILQLLAARCQITPTVLFLDDLQAIDKGSAALVLAALEEQSIDGLFLVCSYRAEYTPPWSANPAVERIELQPLAGEDLDDLIIARFGSEDIDDALIRLITDKTDGNPFFVEEVIGYLESNGRLITEAGLTKLADGTEAGGLPVGLENLLMDQVDHLADQERELLQVAAVAGRKFSPSLIIRAADLDETDTQPIDTLTRAGLIIPDAGGEYSFKNAMLQEAVYSGLLHARRAELHGRIAMEIERTHANQLQEVADILAHHWSRTDESLKAVEALVAAGRQSLRVYDLDAAQARLVDAIETADANPGTVSEVLVADMVLDLARVYYFQCEFKNVIALSKSHMSRVEALDDPRRLARFLFEGGYASIFGGEVQSGLPMLKRTIAIGEEHGIDEAIGYGTLGLIWYEFAWSAYDKDVDDRVRAYGERIVEIGERLNDVWLTSKGLLAMRQFFSIKYSLSHAEPYDRRMIELSDRTGDARPRGMIMWGRSYNYAFADELSAALDDGNECLRICLSPVDRVQATAAMGIAYVLRGQVEKAKPLLQEARQIMENGPFRLASFFVDPAFGLAMVLDGRIAEGVKHMETSANEAAARGSVLSRPFTEFFLGEVFRNMATSGETPPWPVLRANLVFLLRTVPFAKRLASRHLESALASFRGIEMPAMTVLTLFSLGELQRHLKNINASREYFEEGRTLAQSLKNFELVTKFEDSLALLD